MPASRERGCVCVCVSFFRLHRGEEGRVAASHSPELAGQDRHQEHEDALFAYAETNQWMLRLWMIMSVLVCVELPGARVLPGIVRLTCVHGRRLWYAREPRTESVCVRFVRF